MEAFPSPSTMLRNVGASKLLILSTLAVGLLIGPASDAFANNKSNLLGNSNATIKLTIPPKNCNPERKKDCLLSTLTFSHRIVKSQVGIKVAAMGVFNNQDCTGPSLIAITTDQIANGEDSRRSTPQQVFFPDNKISSGQLFACLYLFEGGKTKLFGKGPFNTTDGVNAKADLKGINPI